MAMPISFLGFLSFISISSFLFLFYAGSIKLQLHSFERKRRGAYGFDSMRSYRIYFAYALGQINLRQTHRLILPFFVYFVFLVGCLVGWCVCITFCFSYELVFFRGGRSGVFCNLTPCGH
uniref:RH46383p n=1 Tax=Drosophila melanogaster TaxID=7227 RepID=Q3ZAP7_DROME|nr:RH46383p [Drosophila melanogaster]